MPTDTLTPFLEECVTFANSRATTEHETDIPGVTLWHQGNSTKEVQVGISTWRLDPASIMSARIDGVSIATRYLTQGEADLDTLRDAAESLLAEARLITTTHQAHSRGERAHILKELEQRIIAQVSRGDEREELLDQINTAFRRLGMTEDTMHALIAGIAEQHLDPGRYPGQAQHGWASEFATRAIRWATGATAGGAPVSKEGARALLDRAAQAAQTATQSRDDAIIAAKAAGLKQTEIARAAGVSQARVSQILNA